MRAIYQLLLVGLFCFLLFSSARGQTTAAASTTSADECHNTSDGNGDCGEGSSQGSSLSFDAYTGNEFRQVRDLEVWGGVGEIPLVWTRYGNSRHGTIKGPYGTAHFWTNSFMYRMFDNGINGKGQARLTIIFPEGDRIVFTQNSNNPSIWLPPASIDKRLFQDGNVFTLQTADGFRYHFEKLQDNQGDSFYQLQYILDSYENKYTLSYTNTNRLARITEPAGRFLQVTYGSFNKMTLITQVSASDGHSVQYHYNTFHDSITNWVVLDSVYYDDGTKARYEYTQSEPGVHPMLSHAIDPRVVGAGTNMIYTYNTAILPGFIQDERNGVTGEVMASLTIGPVNDIVCHANGKTMIFEAPTALRGKVQKATNGLGEQTFYDRFKGGLGFVKSITDALGRTTTYDSVTVYNNPIQVIYPDGSAESWTRDELDLMLTHTDELGRVTTYTRDSKHRIIRVDYPDNNNEKFTYNDFGQVLTHTLRNKGVEKNGYDYRGQRVSFTDALGNVTRYSYDGADRLAKITDANGHATQYKYNARGLVTKQINADGTSQQFSYDTFGNRTKTTDELGHSVRIQYDEFKRPVVMLDALGRKTSYSYDLPGGVCGCTHDENKPTKIISPSGKMTTIQYDVEWQKLSQTEGAGTADAATTFYEYDAVGNLINTIDPNGKEWKVAYEKRNRRKASTDPLGNTTQWEYDAVGNIITIKRPDGTSTTSQYDVMNRVVLTIDSKGQVAKMHYDSQGSMDTLIDLGNRIYAVKFDLLSRKTKMIYPDGLFEAYTYDPVGNLKTYRARAKQLRTYEYDSRNREIHCSWTSPWPNDFTPAVTKTYDNAGRLVTMTSSVSTLSYTYNNANETLSETQDISGGPGPKMVSYTYNKDGLRNTMTYLGGTVLNYTYTSRNQINSISVAGSQVVKYIYDSKGNRTGKLLGNATSANYSYDAANRMLKVDNLKGAISFARFDYDYDKLDRRKFEKRDNGKGDVYSYDATNQITRVQYGAANPDGSPVSPARTVSYDWDSSGNRSIVIDNGVSTDYAVNNMNQYTKVGTLMPTYYRNANLKTFNGWLYTYDAQNRLLKAQKGATTTSFDYDAKNRCVKRTINGTSAFLYYDDWDLIEERSVNDSLLTSYIHGETEDEPLEMVKGNDTTYYHMDALGSIVRLTNNSGNVIEQYSYDVFGKPSIKTDGGAPLNNSAFSNRFLFTGREYIQELGLYDYRNRMYSDALGRFLQIDPIRFDGGDKNLYRYVGNNSVNGLDPNGLCDENKKDGKWHTNPDGSRTRTFKLPGGGWHTETEWPDGSRSVQDWYGPDGKYGSKSSYQSGDGFYYWGSYQSSSGAYSGYERNIVNETGYDLHGKSFPVFSNITPPLEEGGIKDMTADFLALLPIERGAAVTVESLEALPPLRAFIRLETHPLSGSLRKFGPITHINLGSYHIPLNPKYWFK